jgi:c-di-GMP-binding flagellar brake protein YcgR
MSDFAWNVRKAVRVFLESQAALRVHRSSKKSVNIPAKKNVTTKLADLSVGGCAVQSSVSIPPGTRVNLFIDRGYLSPDVTAAKRRFSKIVALVRDVRQLKNRKYRLGLEFQRISSEDRRLIHGFIARHDRREHKRIVFPV